MHSLLGPTGQTRSFRHPRDVPGSCSYAAKPQLSSRLLSRQRQRVVRVSAAKSLYEVLGVTESANDRDIKRAYRQKALKLHPDVNKAPNAEAQFLEVKNAFTVLSDAKQKAEYDRKLRGGFGGSWGASGGFGDYGSWGGSTASSSGASRPRPKQQEEEFYGLGDLLNEVGSGVGQWVQQQAEELSKLQQGAADVLGGVVQKAGDSIKSGKIEDFFNDLEKEVNAWSKQRSADGKPASLWEELSAIGEEFVDFLEQGLGDEYKTKESGKGGSSSGGSTEFNHSSSSSKPRTPVDKFEDLKRRYDLYDESLKKGTAGSSGGSSSSTSQGSNNGTSRTQTSSGSGSGSSRSSAGASSSSSSSSGSQSKAAPKNPQKTRDEEVEDELAALKRKLGKL